MPKTPRRSRTMSLREAASVVFALVALLPILLLVYLLSRHELMHSTEAQVGLLAAIGVSVLGFVVFRRMMDQISALAQGFIAPTEANGVFAHLPPPVIAGLRARGWRFYVFVGETGCRFMCAWDTPVDAVERFVADLTELAARAA